MARRSREPLPRIEDALELVVDRHDPLLGTAALRTRERQRERANPLLFADPLALSTEHGLGQDFDCFAASQASQTSESASWHTSASFPSSSAAMREPVRLRFVQLGPLCDSLTHSHTHAHTHPISASETPQQAPSGYSFSGHGGAVRKSEETRGEMRRAAQLLKEANRRVREMRGRPSLASVATAVIAATAADNNSAKDNGPESSAGKKTLASPSSPFLSAKDKGESKAVSEKKAVSLCSEHDKGGEKDRETNKTETATQEIEERRTRTTDSKQSEGNDLSAVDAFLTSIDTPTPHNAHTQTQTQTRREKQGMREQDFGFAPTVVPPSLFKTLCGLDGVPVLRGDCDTDLSLLERVGALRLHGPHSVMHMRPTSQYPLSVRARTNMDTGIDTHTHTPTENDAKTDADGETVSMQHIDSYVDKSLRTYGFFLDDKRRRRERAKQDVKRVFGESLITLAEQKKGRERAREREREREKRRAQTSSRESVTRRQLPSREREQESGSESEREKRTLSFALNAQSWDAQEGAFIYRNNIQSMLSLDPQEYDMFAKSLSPSAPDSVPPSPLHSALTQRTKLLTQTSFTEREGQSQRVRMRERLVSVDENEREERELLLPQINLSSTTSDADSHTIACTPKHKACVTPSYAKRRRPSSARQYRASSVFTEDVPFDVDALRSALSQTPQTPSTSHKAGPPLDATMQRRPDSAASERERERESIVHTLRIDTTLAHTEEPFYAAERDSNPLTRSHSRTLSHSNSYSRINTPLAVSRPYTRSSSHALLRMSSGSFVSSDSVAATPLNARAISQINTPKHTQSHKQSNAQHSTPNKEATDYTIGMPIGFTFSQRTGNIVDVHFLSQQPKQRRHSFSRKRDEDLEGEGRNGKPVNPFEEEYQRYLALQASQHRRTDLHLVRTLSALDALQEKNALMEIFNTTRGTDWVHAENWGTAADVRDWYGVCVDVEGRVFELHLSENNLRGDFPDVFDAFPHLEVVYMDRNDLGGVLPDFCFRRCKKLRILSARHNHMHGVIPFNMLSDLTMLREVWLNNNDFSGELEEGLTQLRALTHLSLHNNRLSGRIPTRISKLRHLQYLSLSCNEFTGEIPSSIIALQELEVLSLHSNKLSGTVPEWIYSIPTLDEFEVFGNKDLRIPEVFKNHHFHIVK